MPAAIPVIAIAATVVGTGAAVYSQRQAQRFQQDTAATNARIATRAAKDAEQRGATEEQAHRRRVAAVLGAQRAAFGEAGVDLSTGSALDTLSDTAMLGELDALTIRANARREAWGYRTQAAGFQSQGLLAGTSGRFNQAGTLITGLGNAASQYYGFYGG